MKLWLDTGSLKEIEEINRWGVLSGCTTNPSLIGKEKKPFETHLKEIAAEVDGPVSGEVVATERDGMIEEGLKLAAIAPNIVVKCPVTPDGFAAVKELGRQGLKTNMTLCFSPNQALLAAEVGATYISPFLGRIDDISSDGLALLAEIVEVYRAQGYTTQVLAASLRHPQHVVEAAKIGADVATMPPAVIRGLFKHILTDKGIEGFLADWAKTGQSI